MRIVFAGTPEPAVPALRALARRGFVVSALAVIRAPSEGALVLAAEKGRLFKAHHLPPPAAKA